jgi:hypothetical protein
MKLAVVDINGSRARAVAGAEESGPQIVALDGTRSELAMAIRLDGRRSEPGRAAMAICRQHPHLTMSDYLWKLGDHHPRANHQGLISPERGLALVAGSLREPLSGCDHLGLCLPAYLSETQAMQCRSAIAKARFRISGTIPSALALALAGRSKNEDRDFATVEVDSHGLTFGHVEAGEYGLRLADHHVVGGLGMNAWWDAILNGIAEICIRQNRRDFRDSGAAEQGIFGQLDDVICAASEGELIEIVIRTRQWCQNLILRPDQINAMCEPLALCAGRAMAEWLQKRTADRARQVIMSDEAASRPGLKAAIQEASKDVEVVEISTTKALCRVHAQAPQWQAVDPAKLWHCLPPAAPPAKPTSERARSIRIWR